ncbi:MAG: TetR/AcrR family transcriptional regulator [Rhodospirillales bacterium]|nr:TetR/AcrR family transcriptional regulator [Rhodospirillales bacterium]
MNIHLARLSSAQQKELARGDAEDTCLSVTRRWLHRVAVPLQAIADEQGPPAARLRRWLDALIAIKRRKVLDEPELFTYHALAEDARAVIGQHVAELVGQLARIVRDGVAEGAFRAVDSDAAAWAVFRATASFHHPVHAGEWSDPGIDAAFEGVWALVLEGLAAPASDSRQ